MKIRFIALFAMFAMPLAFSFSGCGNVCDDAADVCGADGDADSGGECTDAAECFAQCIVDEDKCDAETVVKCGTDCA